MMNVALRRTSSSTRRALSAASSLLRCTPPQQIATSSGVVSVCEHSSLFETVTKSSCGFGDVRSFHVKSGPLDFKASTAAQAEFAVAFDEDRGVHKGSGDEGLEIAKLGIANEIVDSLAKKGITKLFPIQRAVMEPAMQGRDMIGRAKTGTGKTLAFGIPILNRIIEFNAKHGRGRNPLALVLAPTRELARQVEKEFYDAAPSLDTICVYGGMPIGSQMRQLDYGVDVVVGTPGRVIDLLKRGSLNLSEVQFVVLDEADQMLAVGFEEAVETILEKLPKNRQGLMFSATLPGWIKSITRKYLNDPLTVDLVGEDNQKLAEGISLFSVVSDMYSKAGIVAPLVTEHAKGGKCIVFVQTKRDADRLAHALGNSIGCEALHGDISQAQRERTLSRFREGQFSVLVATDVAARGLDIPNVDLVIHYELPNNSEIFVHRSGRTGRAGKKGTVILVYSQEESRAVRGIERDVGCRFMELPKVTPEAGSADLFNSMGGRGRFGSPGGPRGRAGGSGFGRSGGYGGAGGGRSGSFGGSGFGRAGGFGGSSSGRFGSFGESGSGQSGGFGGSGRSGNFGGHGSNRSGGFGSSGAGLFGDSAPRHSSGFGDFGGSGRSTGFGDKQSSRKSGGFGESRSSRFGGFGDE